MQVSSIFEEMRMGKKSLYIEQIKEIIRIEIGKKFYFVRDREGT